MRGLALAAAALLAACAPAAAPPPSASATRVAIKLNWSAVTGANAGTWTAYEAGYFRDEGLDVELTHIASSSPSIDAMIAGQVQFGNVDVGNLVAADVGGADLRLVLGVTNRLVFSVMAKPGVASGPALRGKAIGITRVGSSTHTAALQALRRWGLTARDVTLVELQEVPNILAALQAGRIDAGVVSPPTNTRAKAAGFTELLNLATDGPDYPSVGIAAQAKYVAANPDVVRRFVRAYARGVDRFRRDRDFGITAIKGYLQVDDPAVLEDTWRQFGTYLALPPYVAGIQAVIDDLAATTPKAKGAAAEQFVDTSAVKALDDAGFFAQLGR